jgi:hypothetical protein
MAITQAFLRMSVWLRTLWCLLPGQNTSWAYSGLQACIEYRILGGANPPGKPRSARKSRQRDISSSCEQPNLNQIRTYLKAKIEFFKEILSLFLTTG